jgi:hypothetical protein
MDAIDSICMVTFARSCSSSFGPTSSLQSIHLAPAPGAAVENDERQRHAEKLISPDLKIDEKTKPPI